MLENVTESIQNAFDIREVHFVVPAGRPEQTASPWHSVNTVILFWVEIHFVICNKKMDDSLLFSISVFFSLVRLFVKLISFETFLFGKNTHAHTHTYIYLFKRTFETSKCFSTLQDRFKQTDYLSDGFVVYKKGHVGRFGCRSDGMGGLIDYRLLSGLLRMQVEENVNNHSKSIPSNRTR